MKKVIFILSIMVVTVLSSCTCTREVKEVNTTDSTLVIPTAVDTTVVFADSTKVDSIK